MSRKSRAKKYILFLNNRYSAAEVNFYRTRLKDKVKVAVDGGVRFFLRSQLRPDIIIGDFDSAPRLTNVYLSGIEVLRFSPRKDKTDSQIAVEMAMERGADEIEICGALGLTEIDHTLENIFLLHLIKRASRLYRRQIFGRIISPVSEVILLEDEKAEIAGRKGDYLSLLPLSDGVNVRFKGLVYPAPKSTLKFGDSLSLRNQFAASRAEIAVKGKALLVTVRKKAG